MVSNNNKSKQIPIMADEFKGNDIKYGNIDEVGLLLGWVHGQGFNMNKCILEDIANSLDANATEKKWIITEEKIYSIDNGIGMNKNKCIDFTNAYGSNNSSNKSKGKYGIGGKIATLIQSKQTNVIIYTKHVDDNYTKIIFPWDEMMRTGYSGNIKIKNMEQNDINLFNKFLPNKTGTIIEYMYSDELNDS